MTRYVSRYVVTGVRRERSPDGSHLHIAGVFADEHYYPRQQVLRSLRLMNSWVAAIPGRPIAIVAGTCPHSTCTEDDCITTPVVGDGEDVLAHLPER